MQTNPYQPPSTDIDAPSAARHDMQDAGNILPALVESMRLTKPWVKFLGILGFIGSGVMLLLGLFMLIVGANSKLPSWVGIIYLPLAALYIAPSLFLYRYGAAIEVFLRQVNLENLGEALQHQKSFWRFVGILSAVMLILYGAIFVLAMLGGIGAALLRR
ncbi:MAG TPA: hypothetical protein VH877_28220 [Polyangia bacterium]|jgi:hypothetical protein|nr:hypothetical protein [Polyangia bacterium]